MQTSMIDIIYDNSQSLDVGNITVGRNGQIKYTQTDVKFTTDLIDFYLNIGKNDLHWYQDCENLFVDIFGRDKLYLVAGLFAATSINTSLKSNVTLFRRAYYEMANDLPVGNYLPNIRNQILRVRSGQELSGRKIESFRQAMSGNKNSVVVDIWLLRAFGMDKKYFRQKKDAVKGRGIYRSGGATDKVYTIIENYVREKAIVLGLEARQVSSMIWAGVRIHTKDDRETHYKDVLLSKLNNFFGVI